MKFSRVLLLALPVVATASWFGSDKAEYSSWNTAQLKDWLNERDIHVPNGYDAEQMRALVKANWNEGAEWTQEQYNAAQKAFQDVRQSSFDAWDESRLRQFLLEQGIVAPSSKKEELVLLANKHYRQFKHAASTYASQATASVSSAYYGSPMDQASATASSIIAQATTPVARALDDSKDYVYSTWDDSQLRSYLQEKGVIKTDAEIRRDQLLGYMRDSYAAATDPIWNAWSDSYIHEWLVSHGIIKSDYEKKKDAAIAKRDELVAMMQDYYYSTNDYVWSSWDDSTLKSWLVEHGVVKSDAEIKREKMLKLIQDNYATATDTVYSGWKDSDMRQWLIDNGYMKSDAQAKRDELLKLMSSKYNAATARASDYTVWPDARLRAYLRNHGIQHASMPKTRADLLHEVRIRWVQTKWESESLYKRIQSAIGDSVSTAEEKLSKIMEILGGAKHDYGAASAKATARAKKEL
jgi:hypothetical protein